MVPRRRQSDRLSPRSRIQGFRLRAPSPKSGNKRQESDAGSQSAALGRAPENAGGVRGGDATHSELLVLLRCFPSVGPPPHFPWRSNAGLSDTILSGLNRWGAADGEPARFYRAFIR